MWKGWASKDMIHENHLWGVKAKFLVRVDGNQDGRDPGVDLVTLKPDQDDGRN